MPLKMRKNLSPPPHPECPLMECMGLLGGAWTPNILWHLAGGARRFNELRADIPAVSAKVLTQRLRDLEGKGVLSRTIMPTSPPSVEYALTDLGQEFLPALQSIVEIGHRLKQRRAADALARVPTAREKRKNFENVNG